MEEERRQFLQPSPSPLYPHLLSLQCSPTDVPRTFFLDGASLFMMYPLDDVSLYEPSLTRVGGSANVVGSGYDRTVEAGGRAFLSRVLGEGPQSFC